MKEFRKTEDGLLICEECGQICSSIRGLSIHITNSHNFNHKDYYDKWLKEKGEGVCKICGKETEFTGFKSKYINCCSISCKNKYRHINLENALIKKYNVNNPSYIEEIKEKRKQTNLFRYGTENINSKYSPIRKLMEQKLLLEGINNVFQRKEVKEKIKQTNLEKYGVECIFKSDIYKEKIKQTNLEKYGVEYPNQNKNQYEKGVKTRLELNQFHNTDILYQGTYELDFLKHYYHKYPDIQRAPSIRYIFEGKNKVYHPDFYISSLNLIVEIKSNWTYDPIIDPIKEKFTLNEGYNYIMIIDKNYKKFEMLFS